MALRQVEILNLYIRSRRTVQGDTVMGEWEKIPIADVKKGHVYRMFEPDGTPVDDGEVCFALTDAMPIGFTEEGEAVNYGIESLPALGFW